MKRTISRSAKIGIFGVLMVVLLYLGINFIKSKKIFSGNNTFYIEYNNADGLEVSSPVFVKGFKVGTVDKISFDIAKSTVIVKLSIDREYPIPNNSKAQITTTGLLGGKVVEVILGNSEEAYEDNEYLIPFQEQSFLSIAGDEYQKLKQQASSLVERLAKVLSGINDILSDQNLSNISQTLANLNSISSNIDGVFSTQKENLKEIVVNIKNLSASINNEVPKISSTLSNIESLSGELNKSVPAILADASLAISRLDAIFLGISESKGTLGQLVNNTELFDNAIDAVNALTVLLQDIKQHPDRYINITVFGGKNKTK